MRIERNENHHSYRCWLTPAEYRRLQGAAGSYRDSLVIRLGGEVGLRSFEMPQLEPRHVRHVDGHARLRVPEGKDTEGSGGKPRDAYLPEPVENELNRYVRVEGIAPDEPILPIVPRTVQKRVSVTAGAVADETGNPDWEKVSSHDLRRYYAQTLLVRENLNPRVVKDVGGWSSLQAMKPYLDAPTPEIVNREFEGVDLI